MSLSGQNPSACDFFLISCLAVIFLSFLLWFCVSSGCFPGNPDLILHNTPSSVSPHICTHTHTHCVSYRNHQTSLHFRICVEIDVLLKSLGQLVGSFLFKHLYQSLLFIIPSVSVKNWSRKFTAVNLVRQTQESESVHIDS